MKAVSILFVSFCCSLLSLCSASVSAFLSPNDRPTNSADSISQEAVRQSLLAEIENFIGSNAAAIRIEKIEETLRPIFVALPKNPKGYLNHATVRYALHRLFVQRHGWFIKGLDPAGNRFDNSSSPTIVLKDRVPSYIQDLFEEPLRDRGLGLDELAILASTLEHLIHSELSNRLETGYEKTGMSIHDLASAEEVNTAISTFMMAFATGLNLGNMTEKQVHRLHSNILSIYPFWNETQLFVNDSVREALQTRGYSVDSSVRNIDFASAMFAAEQVAAQYGTFQNKECQQMKSDLLKIGDGSTGGILLADFYHASIHEGLWQFSEPPDYLRQLGALDESDPDAARLIIPNYIGSASNCLASSDFYSVCCQDECESLLGHLERNIASPEAGPLHIEKLVSDMSSSTISGPRSLSPTLLRRLNEVAVHHSGMVPLHGRLFSQWMHHAFPRECPYPHISGTTNPLNLDEYEASGLNSTASEEEMNHHIQLVASKRATIEEEDFKAYLSNEEFMLWSPYEELLVERPTPLRPPAIIWSVVRVCVFIALLVSMGLSLARSAKGIVMNSEKVSV